MPKHKKQKRHMLNMNVIQEEVRSSLSATTDEEKDHLESDFDIESPEFQVFADDEDWTASVDATYVNLLWSKEAEENLPGKASYSGSSTRTERRVRKADFDFKQTAAFKNTPSVNTFFPIAIDTPEPVPVAAIPDFIGPQLPPQLHGVQPVVENNYECAHVPGGMTVRQCLRKLIVDNLATTSSNKKFDKHSNYDHLRYHAIKRYYEALVDGCGKMEASQRGCLAFCSNPKDYLSRCIRQWADVFMQTGLLPLKFQGCHIKHDSLVYHEDHAATCRATFRGIPRNSRTAEVFATKLKAADPVLDISVSTAKRWLEILGFKCGVMKKHIYVDGHERPDVIEARKVFLSEMEKYQKRMPRFTGENMEFETYDNANGQVIIWVNHDESAYDSCSGRPRVWQEEGHESMTPKRGACLMVSGFVSPYGLLDYETLEIGKNKDGYWRCRDLIDQLKKCIPKLKIQFPNAQFLYHFDNSGNHLVYAPDALIQTRLNLSDGLPKLTASDKAAGLESVGFRDSKWTDNLGIVHDQVFRIVDVTGKLVGHKGIQRILTERGLWRAASSEMSQPDVNGKRKLISHKKMTLDEARLVLMSQPDFKAQLLKNWVCETVESFGQLCIFGPKFHCELAPIEMYWGASKCYTRAHCDYKFESLRTTVPESFVSVSLETIRRQFAHVERYMQAYRMECLSIPQIEWAIRKYTSHRRLKIPNPNLDAEFLGETFMEEMPEDVKDDKTENPVEFEADEAD